MSTPAAEQAVSMLRAVGTGVVLTLIAMPEDRRDATLSHRAREAALGTFLAPGRRRARAGPGRPCS